ncbi:hypothetical protein HYV58_01205, partial [Candidatus Peregrinibacteria bacterium]|nr:hypothetical protein [Candidatus Peregrinibacteria bacterium]
MEDLSVHIKLENYESIFSDFDPRPDAIRSLSDDFLEALKKAVADIPRGGVEICLEIGRQERSAQREKVLGERLASHFRKHVHMLAASRASQLKKGCLMLTFGISFMLGAAISSFRGDGRIVYDLVRVVLE